MDVNDCPGRNKPQFFLAFFADLRPQCPTARTSSLFVTQGMDNFIALKIIRKRLPSRFLTLVLANQYRWRLSVRRFAEGFGFVKEESLLRILFLVLFAFWAKDQALQRRVFFLLGYKLFLKPLNGGSLFYDNFFKRYNVIRKLLKDTHHAFSIA